MRPGKHSLALGALILALAACAAPLHGAPVKPEIDPEADSVLHQLSDQNKKVISGIFRVTDTIDDVQEDGRKVQFAHVREITVVRPDKLKVETTGDVSNRVVWTDGKSLTVLDRDKNVYAQLPDPGSIDQAIDMLQEKYDMSLPAADLLSADVYKSMTDGCSEIDYIGIGYVDDEKCHHLAFTRENIDWQLWVAIGDKPYFRKMVITYKQLPGEPQYTMEVLKADREAKINDSVFTAVIPKDAQKIEFHPVAGK